MPGGKAIGERQETASHKHKVRSTSYAENRGLTWPRREAPIIGFKGTFPAGDAGHLTLVPEGPIIVVQGSKRRKQCPTRLDNDVG